LEKSLSNVINTINKLKDSLPMLKLELDEEVKNVSSDYRIANFTDDKLKVIDKILQKIQINSFHPEQCGECPYYHSTTDYHGIPEAICILTGEYADNRKRCQSCVKLIAGK